jgi:hypothetical protein
MKEWRRAMHIDFGLSSTLDTVSPSETQFRRMISAPAAARTGDSENLETSKQNSDNSSKKHTVEGPCSAD